MMTAATIRNVPQTDTLLPVSRLPDWLPLALSAYLVHTEGGMSLREVARQRGCHASTVLRQVRRYENRRDDPLVDEALAALSLRHGGSAGPDRQEDAMTAHIPQAQVSDALHFPEAAILAEARRILPHLCERGTVLAIAQDMDRAAVLREGAGGTERLCIVDRGLAQVFALRDWIACQRQGRVTSYAITPAGRAALRRMEAARRGSDNAFGDQQREMEERDEAGGDGPRRLRYNAAESPVSVLARKRDKGGKPYLEHDLVRAAEQLRIDFEAAQMGPRIAQNWDRFLTGGDRGGYRADSGLAEGPRAARDRVAAALKDLGPGLGDVVLRCCCFLEGLETAERRMGWAARSGKIVLRIALQRLKRHYDEVYGPSGPRFG
ncbi:MAG: hypothetical protein RIR62_1934 [Pseudomonadota bacterium]|jgi:transposase-like protein